MNLREYAQKFHANLDLLGHQRHGLKGRASHYHDLFFQLIPFRYNGGISGHLTVFAVFYTHFFCLGR